MSKEDLEFPGEPMVRVKDHSALEFPGEPIVQGKDPSALEFPEVPRAHTGGVKHDLVFPEGSEASEAKSAQGKEASEAKSAQASEASESETLEYSLESSEERRKSGSPLCASPVPRPGIRALTAVAAVALVGLGVAAARPLDGRFWPVLAVLALAAASVVAGVVACGSRGRR